MEKIKKIGLVLVAIVMLFSSILMISESVALASTGPTVQHTGWDETRWLALSGGPERRVVGVTRFSLPGSANNVAIHWTIARFTDRITGTSSGSVTARGNGTTRAETAWWRNRPALTHRAETFWNW